MLPKWCIFLYAQVDGVAKKAREAVAEAVKEEVVQWMCSGPTVSTWYTQKGQDKLSVAEER